MDMIRVRAAFWDEVQRSQAENHAMAHGAARVRHHDASLAASSGHRSTFTEQRPRSRWAAPPCRGSGSRPDAYQAR